MPAAIENTILSICAPAQTRTMPAFDAVPVPPPELVNELAREYGTIADLGMAWIDIPTDANRLTKPSQTNPIQPFGAHADTSPAFWQRDILWTVLGTSEQTGAVYSLLAQLCAQNSCPPHWHEQDEAFCVLDGQITFMAGDKTFEASAGAFVFIPRGVVHSFRVDSESARLLNFYLPGGFERVVMELSQPAETRTLLPKDLPQVEGEAKMNALFAQVGMHTVAVPDFLRNG